MTKNQRDKLLKNIKTAFDQLRKIPVADEAVDYMYVARHALDDAFRTVNEITVTEVEQDG